MIIGVVVRESLQALLLRCGFLLPNYHFAFGWLAALCCCCYSSDISDKRATTFPLLLENCLKGYPRI